MQKVLQAVFFVLFFTIGAASIGVSVLCNDLTQYYRSRHLVKQAQMTLSRLESLNSDYDALLKQLEDDPNLVKRIAPATLGAAYEDPNAVYPKARAAELAVARKALLDETAREPNEPPLPKWLVRCSDPVKRIGLFAAGAALVLIALLCFAPREKTPAEPH